MWFRSLPRTWVILYIEDVDLNMMHSTFNPVYDVILYIEDVDLNASAACTGGPADVVILYIEDVDLNTDGGLDKAIEQGHPLH